MEPRRAASFESTKMGLGQEECGLCRGGRLPRRQFFKEVPKRLQNSICARHLDGELQCSIWRELRATLRGYEAGELSWIDCGCLMKFYVYQFALPVQRRGSRLHRRQFQC